MFVILHFLHRKREASLLLLLAFTFCLWVVELCIFSDDSLISEGIFADGLPRRESNTKRVVIGVDQFAVVSDQVAQQICGRSLQFYGQIAAELGLC